MIIKDGELQSYEGNTFSDFSSQGGGILVEQDGKADLEDCIISDNTAKEVCSAFETAFRGGGPFVDCVRLAVAGLGESVDFEPALSPLML